MRTNRKIKPSRNASNAGCGTREFTVVRGEKWRNPGAGCSGRETTATKTDSKNKSTRNQNRLRSCDLRSGKKLKRIKLRGTNNAVASNATRPGPDVRMRPPVKNS